MRQYRIYGLTLASDHPLPELAPVALPDSEIPGDITITVIDPVDHPLVQGEPRSPYLAQYTANFAEIVHPGVSVFQISEGKKITIQLAHQRTFDYVRPLLLGGAMAMVLAQRGQFVLHGSTVAIRGVGVTFVGMKGAGKSVFSASMVREAAQLVCDDITVLQEAASSYQVSRGSTQIRLWSDVMPHMGLAAEEYTKVHPEIDKRNWFPEAIFEGAEIDLRCIAVLQPSDSFAVTRLDPEAAFLAILPHYYPNRWQNGSLFDGKALHRLTHLASSVDIVQLQYQRDLAMLDETIARVLEAFGTYGYFDGVSSGAL